MDELLAGMSLPGFTRPPVAEVAVSLGVADRLPLLRVASLAQNVATDFPLQAEADPVMFGPENEPTFPQALFQMQEGAPPVRLLCTSADGERQLQFQNDLVGANWIRGESGIYPSFDAVREIFDRALSSFMKAAQEERGVMPQPVMLDVTYVNIIEDPEAVETPSRVFATSGGPLAGDFPVESFQMMSAERMDWEGQFVGRVVKQLGLVARADTGDRALRMNVSARVSRTLLQRDLEASLAVAHGAVVSGFVAATAPEWHQRWGRTK